ncbi:MAG TPA: membrane dipeptidase [Thermomicrobiaceae bacterium]|nr:membrane dipeptidase [Thermomicrobiaceae bacterium]
MTTMPIGEAARRLQRETFVVDGLVTGPPGPPMVRRLLEAGYDACNWTVAGHSDSTEAALNKIAAFFWLRDALPEQLTLVRSAADLDGPPDSGRLRVLLGFQGAEPLAGQFHFVSIMHALGVRVIQLTYNEANRLGSGCLEPRDGGLTHLGRQVVREMNRLGMVVDLTHVGEQTSLDAIAVSNDPVVFSHSNARALRDNPRNLSDTQLRALAANGGVVGVATFADFVGDTREGQPSIARMLDHLCYIAELIGVDHVGVGTDIMETAGAAGVWWNANTKRRYPEICGAMDEAMHGITGFERWEDSINFTEGLVQRGFSEHEIGKIMGGNFRRVFQEVLGQQ